MKIIKTNDYSIFKLDVNRVVRMLPKHIDRLTKQMKKIGWVDGSIVVVDEKFNLIDGYYRLFAARRNFMSVTYIVVKNKFV